MDELLALQKQGHKDMVAKFGHITLSQLDNFILTGGIYKGSIFIEVIIADAKYCDWCLKNIKKPNSHMALFKHYLMRKVAEALENETLDAEDEMEEELEE